MNHQLDKQDNNLYILGASSISQYQLPDKTSDGCLKTLTIIGESHREDYEDFKNSCPEPKITVPEYINRFSKKDNLMLEIPPGGIKMRNYTSVNVNSILKNIADGIVDAIVTGVDIRPDLINVAELYNNNMKLYSFKLLDVMSYFYMKMPTTVDYLRSRMNNSSITKQQKNYLKQFLNQMNGEYKIIKEKFEPQVANMIYNSENVTLEEYFSTGPETVRGVTAKGKSFTYTMIDILRIFWMKVTDFMILLNLYMSDYKNNVLLVGYNHANNLDDVLYNYRIFPSKYKPLNSPIKHCTNTYRTYLF